MIITLFFVITVLLSAVMTKIKQDSVEWFVAFAISTIILFILLVFIGAGYFLKDGSIESRQIEYNSLITQVNVAKNEDKYDFNKIQVIDRVRKWNEEVYCVKYQRNNLLTSWFVNKEYADSLKYIDIEQLK